jgi:MFS family permease
VSSSTLPSDGSPLFGTFTRWLIVAMAAIGFAFDIYELLMLPLIIRPAFVELTGLSPASKEFAEAVQFWKPIMFFLPAMVGGVFGLLGGYLTDRLGRRRVLTWSIMLYSLSAFLAGFSTSLWMLLILRCTTFIGVCVEFVAAISWLAELFPEKKQKERVLGYTQAFSSFGGLLVAVVNAFLLDDGVRAHLPEISIPSFASFLGSIDPAHQRAAWRYTLMSGLIPALPLLLIRPFLPESPAWQRKKNEGTLKRPSFADLFSPELARTTIVTTIMVACGYGVAFGAIQQMQDIVPGLADVREQSAGKPRPAQAEIEQKTYNNYNKVQEIGGLVGRFLLAALAAHIISRRRLLRVFQIPALIVVPAVFYLFLTIPNHDYGSIDLSAIRLGKLPITTVSLGVFFAGLFTVAQFSFWGNYLPRVYPVHLRGTGESFAMNIGGRMIGTSFAAVTSFLAASTIIPGDSLPAKYALASAAVALGATLVAVIACFFLPEPTGAMDD